MPTPVFLTVEGMEQGLISADALGEDSLGTAWQARHKDKILVQAVNHSIVVPGGVGHARRMHKPLVITKPLDKSSPLLNNALCAGELLKTCRLEWYRTTLTGTPQLFYTIDLSEALITGIDLIMPHCDNPAATHYTQFERVHLAYKHIIWKHEAGRTMGLDTWQGED
ncbi:Hcp family type VI secretion system effector [Pseudomonas sp. v388]|uniref:Hcp family type VI secretion system effector n=1 Tax=Pseudomonas sp. v388 TaxID=2479849 RepID=UPI000F7823B6|nr:Hcp family type VI secretion system effector [Pseudomonas sp. v388]RRV09563.1 Hcp family type VI secretion system effector [Pseudomonas sp. v388]